MELEVALASLHSNIGVGHESQSFKFNDSDVDSIGYKSQNHKVKEDETRVSTDIKRYNGGSDLSPYDMESADYMTTMKLDLKNDYEAQIRDFVDSVSHSSQEIESFRMFQNDMESVKKSSNSLIHDPPEDSADLYMDKGVTECEPELVVCYKETSYNIIKDICVDEGGPTKDNIFFGRKVDEKIYNFFSSWSCENKETMNDNIGINVLNLPATEESDQVFSKHYHSKDLKQQDEDVTQKLSDNVSKEIVVPRDEVLLPEGDEIEHNHAKAANEPELQSQPDKSKHMIEDAVFSSPALDLAVAESNIDILGSSSLLQENGSCGKEESCQVGVCNCGQTQHAANSEDVTNQVHHRLGESSFSSVGHVSGRLSYSGPVPYSGSISLRSDSSTASTRSFAFPILQPEWNSSPVRMAKADRRHYRKKRGWRHHFLCCTF